jgi:hypothetical protein
VLVVLVVRLLAIMAHRVVPLFFLALPLLAVVMGAEQHCLVVVEVLVAALVADLVPILVVLEHLGKVMLAVLVVMALNLAEVAVLVQ